MPVMRRDMTGTTPASNGDIELEKLKLQLEIEKLKLEQERLKAGDSVILKAKVTEVNGKRRRVDVEGVDEAGAIIFSGIFTCFVLEKHVLE